MGRQGGGVRRGRGERRSGRTQSPGSTAPATTATSEVDIVTAKRKAASLRTLGTAILSGTLMPICFVF